MSMSFRAPLPKKGANNPQISNLPRVLFLDVDGVLHPAYVQFARQQFRPQNMRLLRSMVEAGQLTIVLSSSWRLNFDAKAHLRKVFDYYHVPVWVSQTPSIGMYARAREILTWVSKYQPQAWVAVDDWALLMESRTLTGHFLQTNPKTGITPANVETVLRLFEAQVPSAILNELQPASTSTGVAARGRGPLHDGALSGIPEEAAPAVSAKAAAEHQDWLNMTLEEAIPGGGLYGRALATPEGGTVAGRAASSSRAKPAGASVLGEQIFQQQSGSTSAADSGAGGPAAARVLIIEDPVAQITEAAVASLKHRDGASGEQLAGAAISSSSSSSKRAPAGPGPTSTWKGRGGEVATTSTSRAGSKEAPARDGGIACARREQAGSAPSKDERDEIEEVAVGDSDAVGSSKMVLLQNKIHFAKPKRAAIGNRVTPSDAQMMQGRGAVDAGRFPATKSWHTTTTRPSRERNLPAAARLSNMVQQERRKQQTATANNTTAAKPGEAGARKPARHSVRAASASNYPDRMKKIAAGMGLFAARELVPPQERPRSVGR
mmetsp:Transcript_10731/g.26291  ORF Transcript_10731/g.26291 Transcript_10731/m.26291 type:complete len:548 (+) Transcript_10731:203-1846(+)